MNLIQILNKSGKVKLNDVIDPWSVEKLTDDIGKLFGASARAAGQDFGAITNCAENAVDTLEIEINSPGGSIFDGYTICQEIKSLRARGVVVTATITGMAASMASVICMACDTIKIVPHGRMMIHEASQGVRGNSDELRKAADLLDGISQDIAVMYAERTGKPVEDIRALMKAETWMNAQEAIAAGFVDTLVDIRPTAPKNAFMNILKMLFPGNEAEISKVEAALAEVDSLRNDLATFTSEVATLKADLTAKDEAIAEHITAIATRDESLAAINLQLTDATAALETATAELVVKDQAISAALASAGQLATETLASIGQPAPLAGSEDAPPVDHLKIMASLPPAEKRNYWKTHRHEMR